MIWAGQLVRDSFQSIHIPVLLALRMSEDLTIALRSPLVTSAHPFLSNEPLLIYSANREVGAALVSLILPGKRAPAFLAEVPVNAGRVGVVSRGRFRRPRSLRPR